MLKLNHINVRRVSGACSTLALLASTLFAGGCGNAAANVAVGLLGAGLGAEALTGSSVDVSVDVYDPQTDDFSMSHPLAAQLLTSSVAASKSDPVTDPDPAALSNIDRRLAPLMTRMRAASERIQSRAAFLQSLGGNFKQIGDSYAGLGQAQDQVDVAWTAYQDAVAQIHATDAAASTDRAIAATAAGAKLAELRRRLSELNHYKLTTAAIDFLGQQVAAAVIKSEVTRDPQKQKDVQRQALIAEAVKATNAQPANNASEQLQRAFDAAKKVAGDTDFTAGLNRAAEFGADPSQAGEAKAVYVMADAGAATRVQQRTARQAIDVTFGLLTSTPNFGAIASEVTQVLLTPGKSLAQIADPSQVNEKRWRQFGHASVHGGPGNANVVFYMENAAQPVLKSATFDPTDFVVANGKLFQRAFSVIAGAIAPAADATPAAATPTDDGSDTATSPDPDAPAGGGGDAAAATPAAKAKASDAAPAAPTAKKQTATIRAAELKALKAVLDEDTAVKAVADGDATWKPADKGKPTIDDVRKLLHDSAAGLKTAAGAK